MEIWFTTLSGYRGISNLRDIPRYRIQGDTGGYLISGIYPGIGYREIQGIYNLRDIPRYRIQGDTEGYLISGIYPGIGYREIQGDI